MKHQLDRFSLTPGMHEGTIATDAGHVGPETVKALKKLYGRKNVHLHDIGQMQSADDAPPLLSEVFNPSGPVDVFRLPHSTQRGLIGAVHIKGVETPLGAARWSAWQLWRHMAHGSYLAGLCVDDGRPETVKRQGDRIQEQLARSSVASMGMIVSKGVDTSQLKLPNDERASLPVLLAAFKTEYDILWPEYTEVSSISVGGIAGAPNLETFTAFWDAAIEHEDPTKAARFLLDATIRTQA